VGGPGATDGREGEGYWGSQAELPALRRSWCLQRRQAAVDTASVGRTEEAYWKSFSALDVCGLLKLRGWCYHGNGLFVFVYSYSHSTYVEHGGAHLLSVSSLLSARWRLVASFPMPSSQAYPMMKRTTMGMVFFFFLVYSLLVCDLTHGNGGAKRAVWMYLVFSVRRASSVLYSYNQHSN